PDGGIVMAGESINFGRKKVQRSILIKVDSFGCLIPGCHKTDNIEPKRASKCQIYPNPSTSTLKVTLPNVFDAWNYKIMSASGAVIQNGVFSSEQNQISIQNLANGIYQITLFNTKNNHYENHSFIVAR
ncbi:MAG: T9SS type A sorting domain-containing protein, partial [Bacteroidetes bacterium]|nr:T9SS type A sorting domain-containing protein [Bacteroidota bacterium]